MSYHTTGFYGQTKNFVTPLKESRVWELFLKVRQDRQQKFIR